MREWGGHVHGHVRAVHTAVYTTRIRPRTRVYVYKGGPSTRPKTAVYTAENGRLHGRTCPCNVLCIRPCTGRIGLCTQQCTGRVHSRFRPCTLAVYTAVFGCLHSAYTAVYSVVTSGPCIRQVGLPGRVHVPRRHATAVCGPLRYTVRVRCRLHGPCRRTCTRLCMGRVHDRVHGALRPCTWPTAVTYRLGPCTRPCRSICHLHDCVTSHVHGRIHGAYTAF